MTFVHFLEWPSCIYHAQLTQCQQQMYVPVCTVIVITLFYIGASEF